MKIVEKSPNGAAAATPPRRRISIVDDDASIREALKSLMRSVGFDVETFASAEAFLASERLDDTACLILDVSLPGMSGFELQNHLKLENHLKLAGRPSLSFSSLPIPTRRRGSGPSKAERSIS